MPDIIQLLPEHVANQIAAGEVVQRPASVVKELIENAVDAGSPAIKVIIKEAGKTLIQVIDNGKGMSGSDARLSFMRHATSKIRKAEDLLSISSMGFRGEALPSIGAVAQVCLKTLAEGEETGTEIDFEGGELKNQKAHSGPSGTSVSVKNLFFNIPARRIFLKNNNIEFRHIVDEFQRQGLAHPEIFFSLSHDGNELYHLPVSALRQRIIHLFGNSYSERLIPVEESTGIMELFGYVGKPEFARKTRGEQFFFINGRYIKEPYFHHAVMKAYEEMLPAETVPFYCLCLKIPYDKIDINVHPSKTEIKFEDEKLLYAILRAAVKRALGKYIISPSIDFDAETGFSELGVLPASEIIQPVIKVNHSYNPFLKETQKNHLSQNGFAENNDAHTNPFHGDSQPRHSLGDSKSSQPHDASQAGFSQNKIDPTHSPAFLSYENYALDPESWKKKYNIGHIEKKDNPLFSAEEENSPFTDLRSFSSLVKKDQPFNEQSLTEEGLAEQSFIKQGLTEEGLAEEGLTEQGFIKQGLTEQGSIEQKIKNPSPKETFPERAAFQIHLKYLVTSIKSGMLIIDQQAAHERILYENYLEMMQQQTVSSQQTLFPQTITLSPSDHALIAELSDDIKSLGFEIREFGRNTWVLDGIPAGLPPGNEQGILEVLLENYKENYNLHKIEKRDNLARSLARKAGLKSGRKLDPREINLLIDQLFACSTPSVTPGGKSVFITLDLDELIKKFEK